MTSIDYNKVFGSHNRWNEDSISWYEEASEFTGYHKFIMNYIGEVFRPDDEVCEVACGSGMLTLEISPLVKKITANEINSDAIKHLEKLILKRDISNVEPLLGDWKSVCTERQYDILIYSHFNAMTEDWDTLKSITKRKIIAVLPSIADQKNLRGRETYEEVKHLLDQMDIYYNAIPLKVDFGQPFEDRNQAREYLRHYYNLEKDSDIENFIDAKMKPISMIEIDQGIVRDCYKDGLYFPKIKKIGIIIAKI